MGGGGSKYFSDLFRPQFSEYSLIFTSNTLHNSIIPGKVDLPFLTFLWPESACVVIIQKCLDKFN